MRPYYYILIAKNSLSRLGVLSETLLIARLHTVKLTGGCYVCMFRVKNVTRRPSMVLTFPLLSKLLLCMIGTGVIVVISQL